MNDWMRFLIWVGIQAIYFVICFVFGGVFSSGNLEETENFFAGVITGQCLIFLVISSAWVGNYL